MQKLKDWFYSLNPRERIIVSGGAVLIVLVALYTFALSPFYKALHERSERVARKQSDLAYMQSVAGELQALGASDLRQQLYVVGRVAAHRGEQLAEFCLHLARPVIVPERVEIGWRFGHEPTP